MLHVHMAEAPYAQVSDQKSQLTNLFVALDALGPEIQRLATQLRQIQKQSEESFNARLDTAAATAEENLKKAVKAAENTTRNQVLTDLRAKYSKELESA